jgi:hypothetical protein
MLAGIAIILILFGQGQRLRIMPVPTLPGARRAALGLFPENPKVIVELGSGWGGMTQMIREAYPDAEVIAYERSIIPYAVSRMFGSARRGDLFYADISEADVVFCYLSPWHMQELSAKFEEELKDGACVISVAFPLPYRTADAKDSGVYLYRFTK